MYIHILQNYLFVFYSEFLVGPKASAIKVDDLQFSPTRDKVIEVYTTSWRIELHDFRGEINIMTLSIISPLFMTIQKQPLVEPY